MSIRDLLAGVKPRTKSVKLTDEKSVVLHEFSTKQRMAIDEKRFELADKKDVTAEELNRAAARVVAMSMLGSNEEPSNDDIDAIIENIGLDLLDSLYLEALAFSGINEEAQEEARKN